MPAQTTVTNFVFIPDGCKVEVDDGSGYADLGATSGDVNNTLEYDENKIESSNAGIIKKSYRNMRITGTFTLMNQNPELIEKLGGGMFTRTTVSGSVDPEDQTLTAPQVLTAYNIIMLDSSGNYLRPSAAPTITSVTGGTSGVIASSAYDVFEDSASVSGYSISFESGAVDGSEDVVIVYPSQTMNTAQTLKMGTTADTLTSYAMRFTHTDDNGKVRRLDLFSVTTASGGFQFNFKGATSDGAEEMPISYEAVLDTSRIDGDQLAEWYVETGTE